MASWKRKNENNRKELVEWTKKGRENKLAPLMEIRGKSKKGRMQRMQ